MNLIIVGGTGLIGKSVTENALSKQMSVTSLSLDDCNAEEWYPKEAKQIIGDVFALSEDELYEIFNSEHYDALIYAIGPDGRISSSENAYKFFHKRLVEYSGNVFRAARRAGIKKAILCSSYYLYFDKKFPKKKLSYKHPYIKALKEQANEMIHIGMDDDPTLEKMDVCIMELPYVFGACPNRRPLWRDALLERVARGKRVVTFPNGGSVMSTSERVGEAIVAAVEYGKGAKYYTIGDENHDYNWMIDKLITGVQGKPMKIWNAPKWITGVIADMTVAKKDRHKGLHHGFDYYHLMTDVLGDYFYYPQNEIDDVNEELHIKKGDGVEDAIIETGKACYDDGEWK